MDALRLELPMPPVGGGSDGINDVDGDHIFAVNPLSWLEQVRQEKSAPFALIHSSGRCWCVAQNPTAARYRWYAAGHASSVSVCLIRCQDNIRMIT